jgi:hypothetical protein
MDGNAGSVSPPENCFQKSIEVSGDVTGGAMSGGGAAVTWAVAGAAGPKDSQKLMSSFSSAMTIILAED